MNFQPLIPVGGLPGWVLLNNTLDRQTEIFNKSPLIIRDTEYFEQNIGTIQSAEDLVNDRRLLRVALGAFGLGDDLDSRALIRKVLEEGTSDSSALANRLTDERYKTLSDAFGFGDTDAPNTLDAGFGAEITEQFRRREFEMAVGDQDQALRLAMNAQRELGELVSSDDSEDTKWFTIMGTPPLRQLFETALGLPKTFAQVDIDRQLSTFKELAGKQLKIDSLADLSGADAQEQMIRRFLLRDQIAAIQVQSSSAIALTLLQSSVRVF